MAEKSCNFCGRPRNEVQRLVTAPDGVSSICNRCVAGAHEALSKIVETAAEPVQSRKPRDIMAALDASVIGQASAKRKIALALYSHLRRRDVSKAGGTLQVDGEAVEIEKSNMLFMGPSGTGKTLIARTISRLLGLPFYVADATKFTTAGYVGDDVESMLQGLIADAGHDFGKAEWGVIFVDEFDKIARKSGRNATGYKDVSGEGVQQTLLKMLEGTIASIPRGRSLVTGAPSDKLDTTNILFICAGSVAGIESIVGKRLNDAARLGFNGTARARHSKTDVYNNVGVEDLEEFGMIPEILGRLPVLASTKELTIDEMVSILNTPKNAICKQFRAAFSMDGVDLTFDADALRAIAERALKHSTGARALRTIVESVLEPYAMEAAEGEIKSLHITAAIVNDTPSVL